MSVEENKAIARRFVNDGINAANLAVFDELLVPDVIDHYAPPGLPPAAKAGNKPVSSSSAASLTVSG
ncbi:MAG: hypothetical protein DPW09_10075 [Anaerolineae bacterium]|nr:hypothetical protein [Anaerolineae bacterium]